MDLLKAPRASEASKRTSYLCPVVCGKDVTEIFRKVANPYVVVFGGCDDILIETLPEAQRTHDIEFIIQITFMAEIKQTNK